VECDQRWDDESERWRIYFTSDKPPKPVTYCPDCAKREFRDSIEEFLTPRAADAGFAGVGHTVNDD
jgi:hypothetical protein